MIKQLLEYNWKVFKSSLTTAKIFVLAAYGLLLLLIFANSVGIVFSIISIQDNAELYRQYDWLTAERSRFLLLVFANLMWISQFVFTNVRQLQLEENRKLLTVGYPIRTLARHLTWIRFFHPVNLLFNVAWFIFLFLPFRELNYIPIVLAVVTLNYTIIFSLKFRFLNVVRDFQKWMLMFSIVAVFLLSMRLSSIITPDLFITLDLYIPTVNSIAVWLPGGMMFTFIQAANSLVTYLAIFVVSVAGSYSLFQDHTLNTKKGLQAPASDRRRPDSGNMLAWFCRTFGNQAGKYLYYVTSHPYNRVQALFFILFPAIYLPLMVGDHSGGEMASNFLIFFFLMYTPLGFMILSVGNIFGYENRELLLHMQFPLRQSQQIKDRYLGALLLPMSVFVVITIIELILFFNSPQLLTVMLGNMFLLLCLLTIFTWSSFAQYDKIPWISFSFTQPVVSKSAAMVSGVLMIISCIIIYIPYRGFETLKQAVLLVGIIVLGYISYKRYCNVHNSFKTKILPRLWTEL